MSEGAAAKGGVIGGAAAVRQWLLRWPIILGFAAIAIPTILSLGEQVWSQEFGAHGPLILAMGIWLIARRLESMRSLREPANGALAGAGLLVSLALYAFGRAYDFISLETAGLCGVGLMILYLEFGARALLKNWFPLFYMAFLIPPPGWVMDQITAPLKTFVSFTSTELLALAGLPISREGVTIYVAQYQLLVEDACAGMNSLIGLIAVSLLYIYLMHGSRARYSAILTALTIPVAVVGNVVRIMILVLLTYFFGDEVGQGFLHETAGLVLFAVCLTLIFAADQLLSRILPAAWRPK